MISAAAALLGAIITASWYKLVTMRTPLSELNGARFDVAVIGAGVNGASAAQHLAAAGFRTLLVEQNDFASGSSSRSSRLLHCGLRYLAPGSSAWEFAFHPRRLMKALSMARQAMEARSQIVRETPERVRPMTFSYPIYKETPYAPWQVDLAFKILKELGPNDVPLDYRRLDRGEARRLPLLEWLRDIDALKGIAQFREYRFDWPERIALDAVLDAARLGAEVRNHTALKGLERQADGDWRLVLEDKLADAAAGEVSVMAGAVVNTAGIWIDRVNRMAAADAARRITGTKGIHCMFRLPPECADEGIASMNRDDEPIYCVPWRGLHYLGPTETLYEGDIDDIRPEEDEIEWLLGEANYLLPGAEFKRTNMLFAWAGVRPLTYDSAQPKGARSRELHDLSADGLDNMFALTAGPIMTHRSAGELLTKRVARRVRPSGTPGRLSYAASKFPDDTNSPAIDDEWPEATFADLRHAAAHEMPADLVDLLFRRSGNGWTASMAAPMAERAAKEVADAMGWDDARVDAEAKAYRAHVAHNHLWHGSGS
ncbi:MAG: FAD-dependent oxidoreductase [Alphaproteobacteria bacterium]|nr:FAD-dependent oxidoreductase [Alphaproteobacteria bacterium]